MKKNYEIDMCSGPLMGKIILFVLPLLLSNILQLTFNAADIIVVGRFAGSQALAAVGSTSTLIMMITTAFIGLTVGVSVLSAKDFGGKEKNELSKTLHTSVLLGLICGFVMLILGNVLARPALQLMDTPIDILDQSVLYMRIYFIGMPAFMIYNFGGQILNGMGDTRRPLFFLAIAGVANIVLNLIFVIGFQLDVAGVALATAMSHYISAFLVIYTLIHNNGSVRFFMKRMRLHMDKVCYIFRIGLPAGIQNAVFSLATVFIQSAINSYGTIAMAGSTSGSNIENFIFVGMTAITQASTSVTGQNMGGKKYSRINNVLFCCIGLVLAIGIVMGIGVNLFGEALLGLYSSDPEVIAYGLRRIRIVCTTQFICGVMDVLSGCLNGMGHAVVPMFASLFGSCALRIIWLHTVYVRYPSWDMLFLVYPVTWVITTILYTLYFIPIRSRLPKIDGE